VDEGASLIIERSYGVSIRSERSDDLSRASGLTGVWIDLESRALSQGRKVILVVDDEVSKYEDVFYPLMDKYHVLKAPNPKSALIQLRAMTVAAVVVDLQMGSGNLWTEGETCDFKLTGIKMVETINKDYPSIKVGILTGTRHPLPDFDGLKLAFFARKPIMPEELCEMIAGAIDGDDK